MHKELECRRQGYEMMIFDTQGDGEMISHFPGTDAMKRHIYESQRTVAIIEDERDIADIYSRICVMKGLRIAFTANDGAEALELFKKAVSADVILIDHRMPNMTGLEAMKKMLDIDSDAKFVFLSADEDVMGEALEAGARAFVKKPACISVIYDAIMKVLGEP